MKNEAKNSVISAVICMLLIAASASAESDKTTPGVMILEPIVVTPSRTERSLSEIPSSISVVTEQEIKDQGARNVPDAIRGMEGVYAYDTTGVGAGGTVNMRGFYGGMSSYNLVLVDGVPQNKGKDKLVSWDLIPVNNIARVEVMRGPASSMYGDNAMSGVVNIITKEPSPVPHAGASFSYGAYATQNYAAYVSGKYKNLGMYFGMSSLVTSGFRENADYENIQVYGKTNYAISDTQKILVNFDYSAKTQGTFPWALSQAQLNQNRRQARPGTQNDSTGADKFSVDAAYRWSPDDRIELESIFYYRFEGMESFYTSGFSQALTREQKEAENTFGLPVRLKADQEILGMKHAFVVGTDLERDGFDYEENRAPFQQRVGAPTASYDVTKGNVGPYIQDEIKILDPLRIVLGARYDWVKFEFDDRRHDSNSKNRTMSKVSPNCGAVLAFNKDSEVYGNFGQAFRTPTIGQMFTYGGSSNTDLMPEEADNYEVGARIAITKQLKAGVSIYWMRIENEIWYDNATRRYQNYGKTSHDGVETTLDYRIFDWASAFGNYTYVKAVNDSGEFKDKYLTNVPINKATLGININTDFGVNAYLASTWVGTAYIDPANSDVLGHYNTLDVKISYKYRYFEAFVAVSNILDKKYNSSGYKSARVNYFTPEPGRTFTGGISSDF